jgi:uncharacterized protein YjbI with pentapeptide repeats
MQQHPDLKEQLCAIVEQFKTDANAAIAAANAITILVRTGVRFNDIVFRGIRIPGADLSDGQFDSSYLQGEVYRGSILNGLGCEESIGAMTNWKGSDSRSCLFFRNAVLR